MEKVMNLNTVNLSKKAKILQYIILAMLIFAVPIFIPKVLASTALASYSQYVVGSIVNTALIVAALNVEGYKKISMLITIPSISALASGLVLKTAPIYSVYMIPFIWAGNFAIVYLYKKLYLADKKNFVLSACVSAVLKTLVIYAGFKSLVLMGIISMPKIIEVFSVSMGINQLITALIGSGLAYGACKLVYKK